MTQDPISSWVEKAKAIETLASTPEGVQVIKRAQAQSRGNKIMDLAEKLRPYLTKMFENVRDGEGMLVQPARIRGIALNVAQSIVKKQEEQNATA